MYTFICSVLITKPKNVAIGVLLQAHMRLCHHKHHIQIVDSKYRKIKILGKDFKA